MTVMSCCCRSGGISPAGVMMRWNESLLNGNSCEITDVKRRWKRWWLDSNSFSHGGLGLGLEFYCVTSPQNTWIKSKQQLKPFSQFQKTETSVVSVQTRQQPISRRVWAHGGTSLAAPSQRHHSSNEDQRDFQNKCSWFRVISDSAGRLCESLSHQNLLCAVSDSR